MRTTNTRFRHTLAVGMVTAVATFAACPARAADKDEPATELKDGQAVSVQTPPKGADQGHPLWFSLKVDDHSVEQLDLHIVPIDAKRVSHAELSILNAATSDRQRIYNYHPDANLQDYLYYPVLDAGTYRFRLTTSEPATKLSFGIRKLKVEVTDADRTGAAAAIDRASEWLAKTTPQKARPDDGPHQVAVESLVMAALQSDRSGKYRTTIDNDYVPYLKSKFEQQPKVLWDGRPVSGVAAGGQALYHHAIATLALAEVASTTPAAKELADQGARFLLASQLGPRRPAAWKAKDFNAVNLGGWRYRPNAVDADLSVTGWCVIALHACATNGITPTGQRQALDDAMNYVHRCESRQGFAYTARSDGSGSIRDAIGALLCTLDGSTTAVVDDACDQLDRELFAGTQTDRSEDYPLYYAYYATRLNYLRGGFAWEAWRMTAIRQLLKLQNPDGSFPAFATERGDTNKRYGTALSVLILRMCLNDVPDYLKRQAKGF